MYIDYITGFLFFVTENILVRGKEGVLAFLRGGWGTIMVTGEGVYHHGWRGIGYITTVGGVYHPRKISPPVPSSGIYR